MTILHQDNPDREGNLSEEDYWAEFDCLEGGACSPIPEDVIAEALGRLEAKDG